ncbi:hypothetical protein [Bradyrhizobium ottawaense]|uniref:hypothetical protein n=1 Tax=Bradyrhizobium ottawaense TaxID=931866 RepID=UPI0012602FC0|nr:hypothetical protein [Bradyrhizobium ottawaense]MBR1326067.1 hypothetical protein [Bradyrhizobium ottawaense]
MSARNRDIFQRRKSDETYAAIRKAYGISTPRVRDIIRREEGRLQREAELRRAASLPQQPNYLHLPPSAADLAGEGLRQGRVQPAGCRPVHAALARISWAGLARAVCMDRGRRAIAEDPSPDV